MRKFLILQTIFVFFLLMSYEVPSYGQGKFAQHYNKAIEYYKQGKYDQAGEEFKKALELKPNHVYTLYGLGNTYYCKAKYEEAIKVYTKAIKINPDYPKVHYSLSLVYSKMGMIHDAEREKEIFRRLSQGENDVVKISTRNESKEALNKKKEKKVSKTDKELHITKFEKEAEQEVGVKIIRLESEWGWIDDFGQRLFVPKIRITLKNITKHKIKELKIKANFINVENKKIWGSDFTYVVSSFFDTPLPPDYSKTAFLHCGRGYKEATFNVPDLTAYIYINGRLYRKVKFFY